MIGSRESRAAALSAAAIVKGLAQLIRFVDQRLNAVARRIGRRRWHERAHEDVRTKGRRDENAGPDQRVQHLAVHDGSPSDIAYWVLDGGGYSFLSLVRLLAEGIRGEQARGVRGGDEHEAMSVDVGDV